MRRLAILLCLLSLPACSQGAEVRIIPAVDLPTSLYEEQEEAQLPARVVRSNIYLVLTREDSSSPVEPLQLAVVSRERESDRPMPEHVLTELLTPLSNEELSRNVRTAVPVGTQLLGVGVRDGVADVNLTAQFEEAGPEVFHLLRVAQIVWTLTELPDVTAVAFRIHGSPQPVIDQFGIAHAQVGRDRYSNLAPRASQDFEVVPGPVGPETSP